MIININLITRYLRKFSNLKGFLILANFGNFRVKFKEKRKPLLGWETFLEQKADQKMISPPIKK